MPTTPDPKKPEAVVAIRAFGGFVTNSDPHDVPAGTAIQLVNATSIRDGELRARSGVKVVQFDE